MRGNGRSGGRGWCTDRLILPDKIKQRADPSCAEHLRNYEYEEDASFLLSDVSHA